MFLSVPPRPGIENSEKIEKKNSKNCKTPLELLFNPKQVGKGQEMEKKKIIVPINCHPTRTKEFEKNTKKIQKIIKHRWGFSTSQNILGKAEKKRKEK